MKTYLVQEWSDGDATTPDASYTIDAVDDTSAVRQAKRLLGTRGKWPYYADGIVIGYNLDPPSFGERTRLGTVMVLQ